MLVLGGGTVACTELVCCAPYGLYSAGTCAAGNMGISGHQRVRLCECDTIGQPPGSMQEQSGFYNIFWST